MVETKAKRHKTKENISSTPHLLARWQKAKSPQYNDTWINNDKDAFPWIDYSAHTASYAVQNASKSPLSLKVKKSKKWSAFGVGCGPHKTICRPLSKVRHLHLLRPSIQRTAETHQKNDYLQGPATDADMCTVK